MKILEYQESFGKIEWQEGFAQELAGRTIEEQLRCFAFTEYKSLTEVPYKSLEEEIRKSSVYQNGTEPIPENWYVVVKDGVIVGVAHDVLAYDEEEKWWVSTGQKSVMPYQGYVYSSTSDNNGSGYKERDWYKYLVCLPYDHTLW